PLGPTYIPLTDFGPTFAINVGSIAVFGRNNDPNQSILFVSTGEGDTLFGTSTTITGPGQTSRGVGFLRSFDDGVTWTLLDSSNNVDSTTVGQGNPTPINSPLRDHVFVGATSFKVVVDPNPTTGGEVIVYAALSGPTNVAGIWRSLDSG